MYDVGIENKSLVLSSVFDSASENSKTSHLIRKNIPFSLIGEVYYEYKKINVEISKKKKLRIWGIILTILGVLCLVAGICTFSTHLPFLYIPFLAGGGVLMLIGILLIVMSCFAKNISNKYRSLSLKVIDINNNVLFCDSISNTVEDLETIISDMRKQQQ